MKGIADTGFLVAFGNRNDRYHNWAVHVAREVADPLLTCEQFWQRLLFSSEMHGWFWIFVAAGPARPNFVFADHIPRIAELANRYHDRRPDLADLCLIRMSELHPKLAIITTDLADFRVYRRNRREVIPLIHPPAKS